MADLNDFGYTDDVDDVLAVYVNNLLASTMRSEYKNVETLAADKTLADSDTPIQRLDCNGAVRIVKMPTEDAVDNHPFFIVNSSAGAYAITVKNNAGTETLATISQGRAALVLPSGAGGYLRADIGAIPNDGWILSTWAGLTRTGATTFTTTTDVSGIIGKNSKLKLTDTTTKYFMVYSAVWNGTITTITTIASTDYALVGNPSAIYYSNIEKPFAWPDIFNYTPTLVSLTGSITSYTVNQAVWKCIGTNIKVDFSITITNNGTGSNGCAVSAPITGLSVGLGGGNEGVVTGKMMQIKITSANWNQFRCYFYDGTYPGAASAELNGSIIYGY